MFLSKKIRQIEPYTAGEQPKPGSMIKLNTNESPFPPSKKVSEAVQKELPLLNLYPEIAAETFLRAVAKKEGLQIENVFVGNGSDEVLALCFPAFFDEDRPILIPALTYSFYPSFAQLFSIPYRLVPMKEDMQIDVEALAQGGSVILANPNAPTTKALPLERLQFLAGRLLQNGDVLIVDEAYIAFGGQSARPLIDTHPNLVITRTLSKDHSLAGLRVGYALAQPHLIDGLQRAKDSFNSYPVDKLAIAGATAALEDVAYMEACVQEVVRVRDWFYGQMLQRGFEGSPSNTNFVFLRHKQKDAGRLYEALKEKGILVRHYKNPLIKDYLRITIGLKEQMQAVLGALDEIL